MVQFDSYWTQTGWNHQVDSFCPERRASNHTIPKFNSLPLKKYHPKHKVVL